MGGRKRLLFRNWFVCCSILCFLVLALGGAGSVLAQDDEFILEEIVVTGSRIVRNNNESSSPIVTVDEKLFQNQSSVAIETALNKLPQFTPTIDIPTNGGDIQPTARNTPGEATVALRGIGANRTLTLINGRRGTPANALGVVDINTIPSAAIEYVETISGGASSTYGADAMAGVLNFIMKDHFEGAQLDVQASINEEGDNLEYQYSGIIGGNIGGDRGNIALSFSYTERQDAKRKDHKWYRDEWKRNTNTAGQFFPPFAGVNLGYSNLPSLEVANMLVDGATYTNLTNVTMFTSFDGQVYSGYGSGETRNGVSGAPEGLIDGYQTRLGVNGQLYTNNIENYLIFPMERYNVFSNGNYQINDLINLYGQAYFSKVTTTTIQEPGPITGGWGVNIDPSINRDVIPSEMLAILDSRPDPNGEFTINGMLPFNRGSETETFTYNMVAGVEGTIPGIDWTWDFNVQHGEAETTVLQTGMVSLERIRAIMTEPNFGAGFEYTGNPDNNNFGAATGICTSGLNPFNWGTTMTEDCYNAIRAPVKTKMLMLQDIYELNFQGGIFELPAGEVRGAVGYSYRENDYIYQNDTLLLQGSSFLDQVLGVYPSGDTDGNIETSEQYAELLIPVLANLPFVQNFSLELGGRRSDYNTTGVSYTYKALADWRILDWLRVRGGYNRAERAPNIAELFLQAEQTFGASYGGDVCSTENLQAWSANDEANPTNWQNVVELCGKLMEASGDPNADEDYYGAGITWQDVQNGVEPTNYMATGFTWLFPTTVGNPDLEPETADTWTAGIVLDSPFVDIPALADLRISADYYMIEITDAIGEQSADIVMQRCTDPKFNPTFDMDNFYCKLFKRNQTGAIGNIEKSFSNDGRFKTSGIDFSVSWGMDLGPGRLGINSNLNYLISKKSSENDDNPLVEYAGTQGPSQNGLNGGSYRFRMLTNFNYIYNDLNVSVQWNHLGPIDSAGSATNPNTTIEGIREYDVFNLSGTYNLLDNLALRFGVNNVLNDKPPYSGQDYSNSEGMIGGSFPTGNYDTMGRSYWMGARVNF